ncbi:Ger(x)C family spore germination protein [Paenibacillus oryzisoli]|uniref:Ger(x)C family spore germination protein n=1 Tax=Paenibacillus oryzisoli TaxID=1850517 RepID=UPI003D27B6F6
MLPRLCHLCRRTPGLLLLCALLALLPGCQDRLALENITLVLTLGIDLDSNNDLVFYASSPVFNKEAKEKNEVSTVSALTLKDARNELEGRVSALISSGKIQNIVVGKRVLSHPGWFRLLDMVYRDPKTTVTARVIAFDGAVKDMIYFAPRDKRRMPLHLAKLVDTAHDRNLVQLTTLFELHRQMYEKGMTPYLSFITKKDELVAAGTALLTKKGTFAYTLSHKENQYLQMLQDEKEGPLSLTLPLPEQDGESLFNTGAVSFYVLELKRSLHTRYADGRFHFDITLAMPIQLTEKLFEFDVFQHAPKLEAQINAEMTKDISALIANLQKHELDPIGLGLYARGHAFHEWEKVKDDWGHAFAQAEITVHVQASIKNMGETI